MSAKHLSICSFTSINNTWDSCQYVQHAEILELGVLAQPICINASPVIELFMLEAPSFILEWSEKNPKWPFSSHQINAFIFKPSKGERDIASKGCNHSDQAETSFALNWIQDNFASEIIFASAFGLARCEHLSSLTRNHNFLPAKKFSLQSNKRTQIITKDDTPPGMFLMGPNQRFNNEIS